MSLDYPCYEELRKRNHPAAMAWQTLPADGGGGWRIWVMSAFGVFVPGFVLGARLNAKSWRMAARDGIDVNDY